MLRIAIGAFGSSADISEGRLPLAFVAYAIHHLHLVGRLNVNRIYSQQSSRFYSSLER